MLSTVRMKSLMLAGRSILNPLYMNMRSISLSSKDALRNRRAQFSSDSKNTPKSLKEKLVFLFRQNGYLVVCTYASLSFALVGAFYVGFERKLITFDYINAELHDIGYDNLRIDPEAMVDSLIENIEKQTGWTYIREYISKHPEARSLFLAVVVTSAFTDVIRIPLTIVIVPRLARWLQRTRKY